MLRDEQGSVLAVVAVVLSVLIGASALALDAGRLYVVREHLSTVADAAALSGAQFLPDNPSQAISVAEEYLQKNNVDLSEAQINVTPDSHQINILLSHPVNMTFAKAIQIDVVQTANDSTAAEENLSAVYGAAPLGVPAASWVTGQDVTLKIAPLSDTSFAPGQYMALALGQSGASMYQENLMYGYDQWLQYDSWVATQTGNMAGPTVKAVDYRISLDPYATYDNVSKHSPRLVFVPILENAAVNNQDDVHIVGFGLFFLESGTDTGNDKGEVTGRFLRMAVEGESAPDAPDFGAHVYKIVH